MGTVQQSNVRQGNHSSQNNDFLQIKDFISLCLSRWYWFLISVVICLGVAFAYLLSQPSVYTRTADILIKDNEKGGKTKSVSKDVQSTFDDLGVVNSISKVQNELIIVQSPVLMEEVVKRLHLDMQYSIDGRFHREVLYGNNQPITVTIAGLADDQSVSFAVTETNTGIEISELVSGGTNYLGKTYKGSYSSPIETPVGPVMITKSSMAENKSLPKIYVNRMGIHAAVGTFKGKLSVARVDAKADVLRLTYNDVSIQRAEDILNTLIVVNNESWVNDKNEITISTAMFIDERLAIIESELGEVDNDISSYKSEHLVNDVKAASNLYLNQSNETSKKLQDLQIQLYMAKYVRSYMNSVVNKYQLLPANSGITNSGIESQIRSYNEKLLQRNHVVANSSESNPLVLDMDKALDDMRDAIHSSIDNMILTLNAQIRSIQKQNEQSNEQIAANPDQAKYLLSVERQQKIKETLYLFLLQKREENALSQAFTAYNTRVITPPYGSLAPTSPKRFNIMVIVFVIGLFIPMIVLFLQENMNTVVRGRKDIEKMTIPFAGEIPLSDKKRKLGSRKQPEVIVSVEAGKRNVINEAFRVLRTNIEFMNKGNDSSTVLLFTSYNQGSGKTYLSMNLAISFALKGKKVLVIDGDLRHASLSKYVKSPKVGLTNYLAQQVDSLDEIIVPFEGQENLYLIPVGLNPPNPTELIGDARFGQMMETLRERYDYIIVDCPPIDIVADTQIIEKYTDRTLFVVRAGLMERGMLDDLDRIYEEQRFKNMALVLNGSSENNGRYGYRYGYKYGYYHSYSYYK